MTTEWETALPPELGAALPPLIEAMLTDCVMMEATHTPDGLGGFSTDWARGRPFRAAIVRDGETETREAQKSGVRERYAVTTEPGVRLGYHAVFMRESDGMLFRVTGSGADRRPPRVATFDFAQFSAERAGGQGPRPVPKD